MTSGPSTIRTFVRGYDLYHAICVLLVLRLLPVITNSLYGARYFLEIAMFILGGLVIARESFWAIRKRSFAIYHPVCQRLAGLLGFGLLAVLVLGLVATLQVWVALSLTVALMAITLLSWWKTSPLVLAVLLLFVVPLSLQLYLVVQGADFIYSHKSEVFEKLQLIALGIIPIVLAPLFSPKPLGIQFRKTIPILVTVAALVGVATLIKFHPVEVTALMQNLFGIHLPLQSLQTLAAISLLILAVASATWTIANALGSETRSRRESGVLLLIVLGCGVQYGEPWVLTVFVASLLLLPRNLWLAGQQEAAKATPPNWSPRYSSVQSTPLPQRPAGIELARAHVANADLFLMDELPLAIQLTEGVIPENQSPSWTAVWSPANAPQTHPTHPVLFGYQLQLESQLGNWQLNICSKMQQTGERVLQQISHIPPLASGWLLGWETGVLFQSFPALEIESDKPLSFTDLSFGVAESNKVNDLRVALQQLVQEPE